MDAIFGSVAKTGTTYFGFSMLGRWYPIQPLNKLFLRAELGFNTLNVEDVDDSLFTGLTFAFCTG